MEEVTTKIAFAWAQGMDGSARRVVRGVVSGLQTMMGMSAEKRRIVLEVEVVVSVLVLPEKRGRGESSWISTGTANCCNHEERTETALCWSTFACETGPYLRSSQKAVYSVHRTARIETGEFD